jgi:adenylate kinase
MNKVYFIGGAKGTGKTTVTSKFAKLVSLEILNTGDYFSKGVSLLESKNEVINDLTNKAPIIADTHYAGFVGDIFSGIYERGLYKSELELLSNKVDLELVLIDLDIGHLMRRRVSDNKNIRDLDLERVKDELKYNRIYFAEYCSQLKCNGHIVENHNLENTLNSLIKIYEKSKNE